MESDNENNKLIKNIKGQIIKYEKDDQDSDDEGEDEEEEEEDYEYEEDYENLMLKKMNMFDGKRFYDVESGNLNFFFFINKIKNKTIKKIS